MDAIRRALCEPLLHFLLIGAALFGVYSLVGDRSNLEKAASDHIVITPADIGWLAAAFTRMWQRPPTQQELEGLVQDHVQEEVLYREALKLGLDQDDTIVRRRMRQKMEFISADLIEQPSPTDAQLQAFLDEHTDKFVSEPQLSFQHVYFSRERRGDGASVDARQVLKELADRSASTENAVSRGDASLWPSEVSLARVSEIDRQFGNGFAAHLLEVEQGQWAGPIESGYGFHLMRINERIGGRIPELSEIRQDVEREWMFLRQKELQEKFYQELRDQYNVTIQWPGKYPEEVTMGAVR